MATFNVELHRDGPGLLLRDILSGEDEQVRAAAAVIAHIDPDILLLTGFDYDHDGHALGAFADLLGDLGAPYLNRFAQAPNTGRATGRDLDGDGRLGRARDAQGYGEFAGQGGMALLSRFAIDVGRTRDFSGFLWADLPGALIRDEEAPDIQRLSTAAHWDIAVETPDGPLHLMAWHATPPVFDGPEDRNGRRNHDEAKFWALYLDGQLPWMPPRDPFILVGDANLDPTDGDGRREAITELLAHPALQDPRQRSVGGTGAALADGGVNARQLGDPAFDTADWDDGPGGPGNLRVDYVLPSRHWTVVDSGVFWPDVDDPDHSLLGETPNAASRHRLVWVDLVLQR